MDRPYDDIPRQGEHLNGARDEEPSTNVRAQDPPHPLEKTKATREIMQLLFNPRRQTYRLVVRPKDGGEPDADYEEVASIPKGGDVSRLLERIPGSSRYAVYESSEDGSVLFDEDRALSKDWAEAGVYDKVTVFSEMDAASTYANERREASAEQ